MTEKTAVNKLRELCQTMPQFEALVTYDEAMIRDSLTAEEFFSLCARFAYILKQEGVLPGDYVTTMVPLSHEATIVTFGIMFAGAVPASLEITYVNGKPLLQQMDRIKTRLMILRDEPWDDALNLFKHHMATPADPNSIMVDMNMPRLPHLKRMMLIRRSGVRERSFIEMLRSSTNEYVYDGINENMVALLHFTSGSDKEALKMTEITHRNLMNLCDSLTIIRNKPYTKMLYTNPWFWVSSSPYDFFYGVTRVYPDKWCPIKNYPAMLLNIIRTEGVQHADLQPVDIIEMISLLEPNQRQKPLRLCHVMGMPITRAMLQDVRPIADEFFLAYGSHEMALATCHHVKAEDIDSYQDFDNGVLLPGVQLRLIDENGKDVPEGETGRVIVKTPGMFRGYPFDPEKTAKVFNSDNWFVTFDKGRIDPKNPGASLTKEEVINHVVDYITKDKAFIFRPKHVLFFDTFPRNSDGSVDRAKLYDIAHDIVHNH